MLPGPFEDCNLSEVQNQRQYQRNDLADLPGHPGIVPPVDKRGGLSGVNSSCVVSPQSRTVHTAAGSLIINADDWGRDRQTTDRISECLAPGRVSTVSAMVFMQDSSRAAEKARENDTDAGLHLNLTTAFSAPYCQPQLAEQQRRLREYLGRNRFARAVFHPGLARSFEYVVTAQLDEFRRLYGADPNRLDGHHHMHLCANVLRQELLPAGIFVRRNFSFGPGDKGIVNRLYRKAVDRRLAKRHRLVDFLFSLPPIEPADRLGRIFSLARQSVVEVETHPVNLDEYEFLTGDEICRRLGDLTISRRFAARCLR